MNFLTGILSIIFILTLFISFSNTHPNPSNYIEKIRNGKFLKQMPEQCNLAGEIVQEIANYQDKVDQIIQYVVNGPFKGRAFAELAKFVDKFDHRLPGSEILENSIDYMMDKMKEDGRENVVGENVPLQTNWKRGEINIELRTPKVKSLNSLSLGMSVSTLINGFEAEAIVIHDYEELEAKADQIPGKIVVYNYKYVGYGASNDYRGYGASRAAQHGALGALVKSSTPFSLNTPHTGGMVYFDNTTKIPFATLTVEDAEYLDRLSSRGETLKIFMLVRNEFLAPTITKNSWGDLIGYEKPDEFVIVSAHIDCWDVGQGALDDGSGVIMASEALTLLAELDFIPRRTMRALFWTAEEFGLEGAATHDQLHREEYEKISAAFEIDHGTFRPQGLDFSGSDEAACIVLEILKLFESLNSTAFELHEIVSTDIYFMQQAGVPGFSLKNEGQNDYYFYFHHSPADTMSAMNSNEMDQVLAFWSAVTYIVADLSIFLPRVEV